MGQIYSDILAAEAFICACFIASAWLTLSDGQGVPLPGWLLASHYNPSAGNYHKSSQTTAKISTVGFRNPPDYLMTHVVGAVVLWSLTKYQNLSGAHLFIYLQFCKPHISINTISCAKFQNCWTTKKKLNILDTFHFICRIQCDTIYNVKHLLYQGNSCFG